MIKKLLSLLLLSFTPFFAIAGTIENQIHQTVAAQSVAQIDLLEKLVNINSGTNNPTGVHVIGEKMRAELNALGFKTRWAELPANMHHAGTLIAERDGHQGKKILLIGHLDTVFPANSPFQTVKHLPHQLKGPGVLDDKGGLVVMLYALKALQAQGALDDTHITIVLTGDEEDSGKPTSISRKPLKDVSHGQDIALDFEPAITYDTLTIARRGVTNWSIESQGNESHSATIFQKEVGAGAIFELARMMNRVREEMAAKREVTINPGLILAGTQVEAESSNTNGKAAGKQNVVAKKAFASGDFRFLNVAEQKHIKAKLMAIAKDHLPGTKSIVSFQDAIPAMPPTQKNLDLLKLYSDVSITLGHGKVSAFDPKMRGSGDISHVADIVPANLSGLGPIGMGTHSVIETLDLPSLPIQTERAALLIYRLTHT